MKKRISILLVFVMAACMLLAGCGKKSKLVKKGVLTMATNAYFPPYEYYDGSEVVGIDVEICRAVAEKMGLKLEVQDMEFDSIITAVSSGKAIWVWPV